MHTQTITFQVRRVRYTFGRFGDGSRDAGRDRFLVAGGPDEAGVRQVEEMMAAEASRILTALGLVAASVGLTIYGIGAAFVEPASFQMNTGIILMVVGVVAAVVGIAMSKRIPDED